MRDLVRSRGLGDVYKGRVRADAARHARAEQVGAQQVRGGAGHRQDRLLVRVARMRDEQLVGHGGEDDADVAFVDVAAVYDLALVKTGPAAFDGSSSATFTITVLR